MSGGDTNTAIGKWICSGLVMERTREQSLVVDILTVFRKVAKSSIHAGKRSLLNLTDFWVEFVFAKIIIKEAN